MADALAQIEDGAEALLGEVAHHGVQPGHLIVGAWDVVIHDHKDVPGIEAGTSLHFVKEVNGQWPGSVCCHNYVNGGVDRLTGADCPPGMCRKHFFNKSLSSHVGLRP
ncbi:hypothetical protein Bwad002_22980 [Bilophila wadsworthia]